MRCEDCLLAFEDYLGGALNRRRDARLRAHLSACAACLETYEALQREQEVFTHYAQELELTPPLWEGVRARIEQEREAPASAAARGGAYALFRTLFARPAPVAAAALLLVLLSVGFRVLVSDAPQGDSARLSSPASPAPRASAATPPAGGGVGGDGDAASAASVTPGEAKDDVRTARVERGAEPVAAAPPPYLRGRRDAGRDHVAGRAPSRAGETPAASTTPSTAYGAAREASAFSSIEQVEEAVEADERASEADALGAARPETETAPDDSARHFEMAQLLLRSLKNRRADGARAALDISYEKRQSKRLLYRNTVLKQHAESSGDLPVREALSELEPLLLEIANLPDRPTRDAMRAVKERVRNGEVVARLQIYARGAGK